MACVNVKSRGELFEIEGIGGDDPYILGFLDPEIEHERSFQRFCRTYLKEDGIAIDVGANIGVTSLILSAHLNQGFVYAMEPGAQTYAALEKNLSRNDRSNVRPFKMAVSNKTQEVRFHDNSAYGRIANEGEVNDGFHAVDATTLDDFVASLKLDRLDFIKVDIEGFEPDFFEGAKATIEKFSPIIYFELNSWAMLVNGPRDPLAFIRSVAESFPFVYRVCRDDADDILEPMGTGAEGIARRLVHDNVVFFSSVNDVVVSKSELLDHDREKLVASIDKLREENFELQARLDKVVSQIEDLTQERDRFSDENHNLSQRLLEITKAYDAQLEIHKTLSEENEKLKNHMSSLKTSVSVFVDALSGPWSLKSALSLNKVNASALAVLSEEKLSDEDFIVGVYGRLLNRMPDDAGRDQYLRWLRGGYSRSDVFASIIQSREFRAIRDFSES